jgi:hypothetical protein
MEHVFVKISRRDSLYYRQIQLQLPKLYGNDTLSDSKVCGWSQQFLMGREREYVEDARGNDRLPDFSVQLRIQNPLEEMPCASVLCIAEDTHAAATTVFHI